MLSSLCQVYLRWRCIIILTYCYLRSCVGRQQYATSFMVWGIPTVCYLRPSKVVMYNSPGSCCNEVRFSKTVYDVARSMYHSWTETLHHRLWYRKTEASTFVRVNSPVKTPQPLHLPPLSTIHSTVTQISTVKFHNCRVYSYDLERYFATLV